MTEHPARTAASLISGCLVAVIKVSVRCLANSLRWSRASDRSGLFQFGVIAACEFFEPCRIVAVPLA